MQRIKAEAKTAGGIFLPESSVKELNEAKVLAVGPGGLDKEGKRVAPSVAPGDKVLIPQVRPQFWYRAFGDRLLNYIRSTEAARSRLGTRSTRYSETMSKSKSIARGMAGLTLLHRLLAKINE